MKKILLGVFILIGISLYIILNKNHTSFKEKIIIKDLSTLNSEKLNTTTTAIKEDKKLDNINNIKEVVSKNIMKIANKNETRFYNEQIEALKNKDYSDKEEEIYQNENQIFLNLDGEHKKISLGKDEYYRPNLSSNKTYLSYEDSNGIVIQNITDSSIKKIGNDASGVSWHPNEELFVYLRAKDDGTVLTESKIYTYDISNNKETLLAGTGNRVLVNPIFSEDGNYIYVKDNDTDEIIIIPVKK